MYRLYFSDIYNEYTKIYEGESKDKALDIVLSYKERNIKGKLLLIEHKNNADIPYLFEFTGETNEKSNTKRIY